MKVVSFSHDEVIVFRQTNASPFNIAFGFLSLPPGRLDAVRLSHEPTLRRIESDGT